MRQLTMKLAALAGVGLLLTSCTAGSSTSDSGGGSDDSLAVGLGAEPANLDMTKTDGAAIPQALLYNVYETLVKVNQDGKIVPSLAKSWELSDDRKTYTFDLVDDATFSNGEKFTADDVKFSIEQVQQEWTISLSEGMDVVDNVNVLSPTKVEVALTQPSNGWLYRMTTRIGAMMDPKGVSNLAEKPVGTGPYQLKKWTRGDSVSLSRNPDYWGDKSSFKSVDFKYFKDPTALNNALVSGTIDVIGVLASPESLGQFKDKTKYQIVEGSSNGEVMLSFNNSAGPLKNKQTRQAVRHAIDHEALLKTCWAGRGKPIGSMVPPTDPWYEDLTDMYPHDVAKAKSLLKESGQAKPTLRLRIPTLPYATSCGQVVKSQLEKVGITVKLDQLEFPAAWLNQVFTNADYDMTIINHVEPRDLQKVFGDPKYYPRYDSAQFRILLARADQGTKQEEIAKMKAAARLLSEDAAADPLFVLPNIIVAEKNVRGLPKDAVSESFDLTGLHRS
ncbi:MAG: ABC transporter substrate-binding protein [Micromonosporaceae bacterium]